MQKLEKKEENIELLESLASHLLEEGRIEKGYMPASSRYERYNLCWIRDLIVTASALYNYSSYEGSSRGREARRKADEMVSFAESVAMHYKKNLEKGINSSIDDPYGAVHRLKGYLPARVGEDGFMSKEDYEAFIDGRGEWLKQYDTLPWIAYGLYQKSAKSKLDAKDIYFLSNFSSLCFESMLKHFKLPCFNAWETEGDYIHAYDVIAAAAGISIIKKFAEEGLARGMEDYAERRIEEFYKNGPMGFLRDFFVRNNMIYPRKHMSIHVTEPDMQQSTNLELNVAICYFLVAEWELNPEANRIIGKEIAINTLDKTYEERFRGRILGTRFKGDTYFKGGSWIFGSGEYYIARLQIKGDGMRELEAFLGKIRQIGNPLPEQTLDFTESEEDPEGYLESNHGKPVEELAMSYATAINAAVELLKRRDGIKASKNSIEMT
ncbi:MAG: glycoside hydrolase family 15 protein [Candidatus Micrarchaeaceae archaeon]